MKDTHAAEEDGNAQKEELENAREDLDVLAQSRMLAAWPNSEWPTIGTTGSEREEVDPEAALREESLRQVDAHNRQDLPAPQII